MKYISQGPMLLDVHMHRPQINSKNFMDALLAFWPGLQVLNGDLKPAIETHEMLYQVVQKHNFIPEAFTTDFQVCYLCFIYFIFNLIYFKVKLLIYSLFC